MKEEHSFVKLEEKLRVICEPLRKRCSKEKETRITMTTMVKAETGRYQELLKYFKRM